MTFCFKNNKLSRYFNNLHSHNRYSLPSSHRRLRLLQDISELSAIWQSVAKHVGHKADLLVVVVRGLDARGHGLALEVKLSLLVF